MEIQNTILEQIKATDRMALMAWGAKDFKGIDTTLYFRVNGPKFSRGWIEIKLEANDTYTVRAIKTRKGERQIKAEFDLVYCDSLVSVIDGIVG